jgi:hypothetical protein
MLGRIEQGILMKQIFTRITRDAQFGEDGQCRMIGGSIAGQLEGSLGIDLRGGEGDRRRAGADARVAVRVDGIEERTFGHLITVYHELGLSS